MQRKFIGRNKVKICKLYSQNFTFLEQKFIVLIITQSAASKAGIYVILKPFFSLQLENYLKSFVS